MIIAQSSMISLGKHHFGWIPRPLKSVVNPNGGLHRAHSSGTNYPVKGVLKYQACRQSRRRFQIERLAVWKTECYRFFGFCSSMEYPISADKTLGKRGQKVASRSYYITLVTTRYYLSAWRLLHFSRDKRFSKVGVTSE